ncbi:uncharacterized protein LOC111469387 [Cucurbita maxima]|uniref:Uncharacterized protein LOC111469387 n=1 Tax=Cucurbita maxima TaxID=3661 RepID=A0A6J1I2Q0_CUCMA|nr:uncharacterized protein LOC111469387 [Cucurbita maxima]
MTSTSQNIRNLEMKVGEGVFEYFTRVMSTANDMRNCGEDMSDVKIVEKILRSLTDKFNFVVCSIEEFKDIDQLTVDELQVFLLVHEQKVIDKRSEEQVLYQGMDKEEAKGHFREEEVTLEDWKEVDLL